MGSTKVAQFEEFAASRGRSLTRTAYLLTGNRETAADLVQAAFERTYRNWHRITEKNAESFARTCIVNLATDHWRRRRRWREGSLDEEHHDVALPDGTATIDSRDALWRALLLLPARQRAVLVLRYWEDLSEAEIADALGCSPGAVKTHAHRGLERLRAVTQITTQN